MAALFDKNAPNSDNKKFFGGRNYFLFFRLENLSLSLFAQTLSFNRHAMVEEFESSAKNFFTITSQKYLKNATFDLTKHNGKSVLPDTEDNFQQWPHCNIWLWNVTLFQTDLPLTDTVVTILSNANLKYVKQSKFISNNIQILNDQLNLTFKQHR